MCGLPGDLRVRGILVFGDITVDLLGHLPAEPAFGADNLMPGLVEQCGGVGANAAAALAHWGVPVRLVGCVGRDRFGEFALDFLRSTGVDVSHVQRSDSATTGVFLIAVSPGGQRTIFGSRGANAEFPAPMNLNCLDGIAAVHLNGYNLLGASTARAADAVRQEAGRRGIRVSLDVGMAPSQEIPEKILLVAGQVDILFVGLSEAFALTGRKEKTATLASLRECGAKETVVKLGEKGSLLLGADGWCEVPAFPVDARDTTGAGDAFAAAYLRARVRDWPPEEAALVANAAGAAAAQVLGTGEAMPPPAEVVARLKAAKLAPEWEAVCSRICERLLAEFPRAGAARGGGHGTAA